MNRYFQLLLIILVIAFSATESYAFIGKIKALQGIGVFFKTKIFKLGAVTEGARVIDNVATEALNLRKIDKSLITKLSKQKELKTLQSIKEPPDETVLSSYKNFENPALSSDSNNWWIYLHPRWRHLGKDVKPDNFVYACETNSGDSYYFSLMPKRNFALVSSSVEMIGSQRLKIKSSSAKGTVLMNLDTNGLADYFFLLPNYKFYAGKQSTTGEFEISPNGECYNTEINFDKEQIKFVQYQIIEKKREPSFIEKNMKNFAYLIFIWLGWSIVNYFFENYAEKKEKRFIKLFNIYILNRAIYLLLFNLFGAGCFLIILSNINFEWYIRLLYWLLFGYYLYDTFYRIKASYKLIRSSASWTKADYFGIGKFRFKLIQYLNLYIPAIVIGLLIGIIT